MCFRGVLLVFCLILLLLLYHSVLLAAQYGPPGATVPLRVPVYKPPSGRDGRAIRQIQRYVHGGNAGAVYGSPLHNLPAQRPRSSRGASASSSGPLSALYSVVSFPFRVLSGALNRESQYKPPICPPPLCAPMKPPARDQVRFPSAAGFGTSGPRPAAYGSLPMQ